VLFYAKGIVYNKGFIEIMHIIRK